MSDARRMEQRDSMSPHRRNAERVAAEIEIGFNSDSNFYSGFSENISEGGVFVATYQKHRIGDRHVVQLMLPGIEQPVQANVVVRWVREADAAHDVKPGYGMQFVDLTDAARETIERFVRKRAPMFYET
jgi:uncharacterized protein (TIGR02266 family)